MIRQAGEHMAEEKKKLSLEEAFEKLETVI